MHAQLAAIVENSNDAIFSRSLDGTIQSWNAGAEKMLGYTAAEAVGRPIAFTLPPNRPPNLSRNNEKVLSGEVVARESDRMTKDGRVIDVLTSHSPIRDSAGNIVGASVILHDVTERKQTERLQTMEHAITKVLAEAESIPIAIPRIIQTICESLGWACGAYWRRDENAQVLRCATTWHVDAEQIATFMRVTAESVNEAPAWQGEAPRTKTGGLVRRVWIDGAPAWFADVTKEPGFRRGEGAAKAGLHCAFGFPVLAGAQPLGVMEFFGRDIKQPDEALLQVVRAIGSQIGQFIQQKQAEERFRSTFDNAPVGIMHVDLKRRIAHVNAKLCQILGYSQEELIGKPIEELVHADSLDTDRVKSFPRRCWRARQSDVSERMPA